MTKAKLLNMVVVLVCVLMLYACGGDAPATVTPVPPVETTTPLRLDGAQAMPSLVMPGMGVAEEQQLSGLGAPKTDMLASAATLGPPDWVKLGTRLVFYSAAASVAQSRFAWIEDPDGEYTDPKTGKRYRRTDESGESMGGGSGDGFTQIDVVGVEGTDVVLLWALYGIEHTSNQYVPAGGGGAKVKGATVDGVWINPKQLAELQEARLDNMLVLRGKYELNGVTYDTISFANTTPGAYLSYTYDLKTGLLLAATTSTASTPVSGQTQGNTQLTITRFAGVRQRNMPGVTGKNPDWVARTSKLQYSGAYNFINPADPSSANFTFPMDQVVTLKKGGKNWSYYTSETQIQMAGSQPTKGNGITGTTGVYWMDVTALKAMKKGQQLDKDPLTGEVLTVKSVETQSGGKVVTITSQLQGIMSEMAYDQASGVLVGYSTHLALSGITIRLTLKQRP